MDYKSTISEKVVRYDGVSGKITEVDKSGYVHIKFEGDSFAGGYMYDPFLNEDVKFEKQELQALIDAKLLEINQQGINLVNASIAANKSEETYYITKDNEDGTAELVLYGHRACPSHTLYGNMKLCWRYPNRMGPSILCGNQRCDYQRYLF